MTPYHPLSNNILGGTMLNNYLHYKAINWNVIEDELDNVVWERATSLFWLDTRVPIENDRSKWANLQLQEQEQLNRLLILLTNIATYQSNELGEIIRDSARSQQEIAIINNFQFTEMVHTKAYNRILSIFNQDIDSQKAFYWVDTNPQVRDYIEKIHMTYQSADPLKKRFMAICVEGILNYTYLSYLFELWLDRNFLNLGSMLEMIVRNESLHCYYLNYKVNLLLKEASSKQVAQFKSWGMEIVDDFVVLADQLIDTFYTVGSSKTVAINLVMQEANHILAGIGLNEIYAFNQENIAAINTQLDELRAHNLNNYNNKNTTNTEEVMNESDYVF